MCKASHRFADRLQTCECGHKQMVHRLGCRGVVPFPVHWMAPGRGPDFFESVPLAEDHLKLLQRLMDSTYSNIWTRDRKKHHPDNPNVPRGFRVRRAFRFENSRSWSEYGYRRAELMADAKDKAIQSYDVLTAREWASYSHAFGVEQLQGACNEWMLFHGTSPAAALAISKNDFKISLAGGSTGTLYGRGTYLAESVTKADEYAKPAGNEYAMLLVRCLGGRVRYCDELEPDAEDLTQGCIEGPFDCVMGDRQKCRGTYREFIFFDTENLYPEYVIIYERCGHYFHRMCFRRHLRAAIGSENPDAGACPNCRAANAAEGTSHCAARPLRWRIQEDVTSQPLNLSREYRFLAVLCQDPEAVLHSSSAWLKPILGTGLMGTANSAQVTKPQTHGQGYDPEMRLYGGEEMEIGFRTWMCGGDIEYLPCSHVGHIFRTPKYWQGQVYKVPGEEISRNKLRTAEVWMDEFKSLVTFATGPLPANLPIGDLEPRRQLREKLKCKDFRWYLQTVIPHLFVPKVTTDTKGGALRNQALNACLDTLGSRLPGEAIGAYPCHGQHGTQALVEDKIGWLRVPQLGYKMCLSHESGAVGVRPCRESDSARLIWKLDSDLHLKSRTGECMEVTDTPSEKSPFSLVVSECKDAPAQEWHWS
ncbi:unnamed protein product [Effrenium voratum]|nr:unnamed protein product [Effrenium voratum]